MLYLYTVNHLISVYKVTWLELATSSLEDKKNNQTNKETNKQLPLQQQKQRQEQKLHASHAYWLKYSANKYNCVCLK